MMDALSVVLIGTQLVFTIIAGLYFYSNLKTQSNAKSSVDSESRRELSRLKAMRNIKLNKPLSEISRPSKFNEIIGQDKGIRALRTAMCGPAPQHVIIYGPPGIGKTAAARLALENAQQSDMSPFSHTAPFIEVDATVMQFDERSIADPLIGSVHDPIYQGAGSYGPSGIPQPKQGAVTNAHGGVLFIDEIGELSLTQMNKLLKVLEDRKVLLSSSYYSSDNKNIPGHIHDIFTNGLPADFRLVGATTRRPEDLPPALRSRCSEVYFRALGSHEIMEIAVNAFNKAGVKFDPGIPKIISGYCTNGRDTVNIVQASISHAALDERSFISTRDIEEVIDYGRYSPNISKRAGDRPGIGVANGLAVTGRTDGVLLEIEACAEKAEGQGSFKITGIIEEEEIKSYSGNLKRSSTIKGSIENVITVLKNHYKLDTDKYNIRLNFPGQMPIDGPSAGAAIFTALYSALTDSDVPAKIAMTGEIGIKGRIHPVGGVTSKIEAAIESGVETVYIPFDNYQSNYDDLPIKIIKTETVSQLTENIFGVVL